jgi:sugar lactone lactonase YvrE
VTQSEKGLTQWVAQPATDLRAEHAEGPCWDPRLDALLWVDQFDGIVYLADFDKADRQLQIRHRYQVGSPIGAVVPCAAEGSGWLVACAGGFAHLTETGGLTLLGQPEAGREQTIRMNDGKCDPQGRFWAGSMAWSKEAKAGSLYRLDERLDVRTMLAGTTISNGLAWAADGATMYYIDTPTRRVDRFGFTASGELLERRVAVAIPPGDGEPDGMCIDERGNLWIALWGGSSVRCYSPDGVLLAVVAVDAPQVSSCAFGGPTNRTLFITTSQEGMGEVTRRTYPQSGKVFCVDVNVAGPPTSTFTPNLPGREA